MGVVVAAHAEDAVDGEALGLAAHGQTLDGGWGEEVLGHGLCEVLNSVGSVPDSFAGVVGALATHLVHTQLAVQGAFVGHEHKGGFDGAAVGQRGGGIAGRATGVGFDQGEIG